MREQTRYMISDAARKVAVESHVLRYWEEELGIPIKRNELGHRYYTEEDVIQFKEIKALKEQGLQLKAIRMILKNGQLHPMGGNLFAQSKEALDTGIKQEREKASEGMISNHNNQPEESKIIMMKNGDVMTLQEESKEAKGIRLQQLLKQMITDAVKENNQEICREIKEGVLKEMDYQFRMQEEREEEWEKKREERDEAYYRKMDELIRKRYKRRKEEKQEEVKSVQQIQMEQSIEKNKKKGFFAKRKASPKS